jgi:hypothetical protein
MAVNGARALLPHGRELSPPAARRPLLLLPRAVAAGDAFSSSLVSTAISREQDQQPWTPWPSSLSPCRRAATSTSKKPTPLASTDGRRPAQCPTPSPSQTASDVHLPAPGEQLQRGARLLPSHGAPVVACLAWMRSSRTLQAAPLLHFFPLCSLCGMLCSPASSCAHNTSPCLLSVPNDQQQGQPPSLAPFRCARGVRHNACEEDMLSQHHRSSRGYFAIFAQPRRRRRSPR